jgi:NADH:ubiquinone reductase (H+-translocating)
VHLTPSFCHKHCFYLVLIVEQINCFYNQNEKECKMKTNSNIIILGGGFAGVMAALRLANRTRRQPVSITLVNASAMFVERTRQHQVASGQAVPAKSLRDMLDGTGVNFVRGKVTALDPTQKTVTVNTDDDVQLLTYDKLIYALGSHTDLSRIPGAEEYAYALEQHAALAALLPKIAQNHGRLLVFGGGLTGIETATELAELHPGLQVALVTSGALSDNMSSAGARHLYKTFQNLQIALHEHTKVTQLVAGQAITDGVALPFDICIYTAGFGVSPLAQTAGIMVNAQKQILVNAFLHSVSYPDIYAVGDAAALEQSANLPLRMACATALPLAIHAAENLARTLVGKAEQPFRFGYAARCISLGRRNGLLQLVDAKDQPRPQVLTGRAGALAKELILHYVMWSLQAERRFAFYQWPQARTAQTTETTATAPHITEALVTELVNR